MRYNIKFDIVGRRKLFLSVSVAIVLAGMISLVTMGLHLGVDFKAGTTLDITVGQPISKADAERLFAEAGLPPSTLTIGGTNNERVSARFDKELSADEVKKIMSHFTAKYGDEISREENTVDTQLAKELAMKAIYGVLIACIGIVIYVAVRFEWRYALAAVVSILYDAFVVITFFSIFRLEVNLPFVAAVLTIVGYSLNDTIVIFDRIRENMRFAKLKTEQDLADLVNQSIWQTMARSINTVLTVLFGAVCLLIFGSEAIRLFSVAMVIGLISGAYSSIFIAAPLWFIIRKNSIGKKNSAVAK